MYDETKLNKASIGDIVYGYDTIEELQNSINSGFKNNDFCKGIKLIHINDERKGKKYKIYDSEVDDFFYVKYVYSISDIVETKTERLGRLIREWRRNNWLYSDYKIEIVDAFFTLKSKGLIVDPRDEFEEIACDWSYDLSNKDDGKRFLEELQGKDLDAYIYAFIYLSADDRFVYHDECLTLMRIEDSAEVFEAVCDLTLRALNELV